MRHEAAIRRAIPHLTERELWLVELDCHRAADAAALGGASERHWMRYVNLENDIAKERKMRFPASKCPFPNACVAGWSDDEYAELCSLYKKIQRMKPKKESEAEEGAGK